MTKPRGNESNEPALKSQPSTSRRLNGNVNEIIGKFGGTAELRMVNHLQELLYAP
jgi:hypothetical protein